MKSELAQQECKPCSGKVPPLNGAALDELARKLGGRWRVVNAHHLEKTYRFEDFRQALAFTNRVGEIAEAQGHHPDIYLTWVQVRLQIWTHKIDGLRRATSFWRPRRTPRFRRLARAADALPVRTACGRAGLEGLKNRRFLLLE